MAPPPKKRAPRRKTAAKAARKRQTYRDQPAVPTAKEIEQSISQGRSVTLDEFVKRVKL